MTQELQTKEILFIIVAADLAGTLHVLEVGSAAHPGLVSEVDWRHPLATTIRQQLKALGIADINNNDFVFMGPMAPLVVREAMEPVASVVIHLLRKTETIAASWIPVVQLLKKLPATKNRIPYVKAVQFISAGEQGKFQAFDLSNQQTRNALLRIVQKPQD